MSSLTCDVFDQHELPYLFIFSLAWEGFGQHKLTLILYSRCHGIGLVNISWVTFYVMGCDKCLPSLSWEGVGVDKSCFLNKYWQTVCVFVCIECIWSIHFLFSLAWNGFEIEIHFVSSLALKGYMLRSINSFWDSFCVLAGMGFIWSTHAQINFVLTCKGLVLSTCDEIPILFS